MSQYYNPQRTSRLYTPKAKEPFKLSRSKIELFIECPRCFYLDRRLGVGRPPGFPFNLNSAVDKLLKKEFDIHRAKNKAHPLMKKYGIDAVPVAHENLDAWRQNFVGVQFLHKPTNLMITGAIDDLWVRSATANPYSSPLGKGRKPEYIVVDYKATSKEEEITELNQGWQIGYKRQMEIYQWLLRRNGYKVSDTGYFVYCNGKTDRSAFDAKLEFDIALIPYKGDDGWVEKAIKDAHKCLNGSKIPKAGVDCDYCAYVKAVNSK
ncbi:PD-(D/E)XK nuclease family protein [Patescibacteria group bacterium]|nr:PD-(D/E)XK nuclease family protein [Patescibacteria group bacterium]MBU1612993.1 PD-(D/E)XK nuclease family protein [Patescibacteria group bacterium]